MSEVNTEGRTLVLFSGGKDSFLTACKCIERGDYVGLISFNNGSILAEKNFKHGASRLIAQYGSDRIIYEGVYPTVAAFAVFRESMSAIPYSKIGQELSVVVPPQLTCFHCQTAMWAAAIAFAAVKGYDSIATGYRQADEFVTGSTLYIGEMCAIAEEYNITLSFPLWRATWDKATWECERDNELYIRNFLPSVLEPKCTLGLPADKLSDAADKELNLWFNSRTKKLMLREIKKLTTVFSNISLSDTSFDFPEYPLPSEVPGSSRGGQ